MRSTTHALALDPVQQFSSCTANASSYICTRFHISPCCHLINQYDLPNILSFSLLSQILFVFFTLTGSQFFIIASHSLVDALISTGSETVTAGETSGSDQEQLMVKNEDNSVVQLYSVGTVMRYMKSTIQSNTVKKGREMEMENEEGMKEKWVAAWVQESR